MKLTQVFYNGNEENIRVPLRVDNLNGITFETNTGKKFHVSFTIDGQTITVVSNTHILIDPITRSGIEITHQ